MRYILVLLLSVFFCTTNFIFADSGYFVVENIEVKQKDRNSLLAKQRALSVASRMAFAKVISQELNLDESVMDSISDNKIANCIYDYSIENEKHSDSFYIAELSYRFDKSLVGALLKKSGIKCDIENEKQDKQNIELVVRIEDYILKSNDLRRISHSVSSFSAEIVTFIIHKTSFVEFRKLGVRYAVI